MSAIKIVQNFFFNNKADKIFDVVSSCKNLLKLISLTFYHTYKYIVYIHIYFYNHSKTLQAQVIFSNTYIHKFIIL